MQDQIISQEGYEKLKKELEFLTTGRRREIADRIEKAKELGDLSENAEYSEAKEAQTFNESRISELNALLKNLTIVENSTDKEAIGMGSKITVKINGSSREYTIVSFNEVDPVNGMISNESPLGRAFIGRKVGDKVVVSTPKGDVTYEVTKIE